MGVRPVELRLSVGRTAGLRLWRGRAHRAGPARHRRGQADPARTCPTPSSVRSASAAAASSAAAGRRRGRGAIVTIDPATGAGEMLRQSSAAAADPELQRYFSAPQHLEFPTENGLDRLSPITIRRPTPITPRPRARRRRWSSSAMAARPRRPRRASASASSIGPAAASPCSMSITAAAPAMAAPIATG